MSDKLRAAAKAALDAMKLARGDHGTVMLAYPAIELWLYHRVDERLDAAIKAVEDALAEPAIKESLNVAEPVGWLHWLTVDGERFPQLTLMPRTDKDEPLYTALPRREAQERMHPEIKKMYEDYFDKCFRESSAQQRPWVGLTGTEINHIFAANVGYPERMMKEVETLLKDKNT